MSNSTIYEPMEVDCFFFPFGEGCDLELYSLVGITSLSLVLFLCWLISFFFCAFLITPWISACVTGLNAGFGPLCRFLAEKSAKQIEYATISEKDDEKEEVKKISLESGEASADIEVEQKKDDSSIPEDSKQEKEDSEKNDISDEKEEKRVKDKEDNDEEDDDEKEEDHVINVEDSASGFFKIGTGGGELLQAPIRVGRLYSLQQLYMIGECAYLGFIYFGNAILLLVGVFSFFADNVFFEFFNIGFSVLSIFCQCTEELQSLCFLAPRDIPCCGWYFDCCFMLVKKLVVTNRILYLMIASLVLYFVDDQITSIVLKSIRIVLLVSCCGEPFCRVLEITRTCLFFGIEDLRALKFQFCDYIWNIVKMPLIFVDCTVFLLALFVVLPLCIAFGSTFALRVYCSLWASLLGLSCTGFVAFFGVLALFITCAVNNGKFYHVITVSCVNIASYFLGASLPCIFATFVAFWGLLVTFAGLKYSGDYVWIPIGIQLLIVMGISFLVCVIGGIIMFVSTVFFIAAYCGFESAKEAIKKNKCLKFVVGMLQRCCYIERNDFQKMEMSEVGSLEYLDECIPFTHSCFLSQAEIVRQNHIPAGWINGIFMFLTTILCKKLICFVICKIIPNEETEDEDIENQNEGKKSFVKKIWGCVDGICRFGIFKNCLFKYCPCVKPLHGGIFRDEIEIDIKMEPNKDVCFVCGKICSSFWIWVCMIGYMFILFLALVLSLVILFPVFCVIIGIPCCFLQVVRIFCKEGEGEKEDAGEQKPTGEDEITTTEMKTSETNIVDSESADIVQGISQEKKKEEEEEIGNVQNVEDVTQIKGDEQQEQQEETSNEIVTVIADFDDPDESCLSIRIGDTIQVIDKTAEWWEGILDGRRGYFPSNYVQVQ